MKDMAVETDVFLLNSEGLLLRVFIASPASPSAPLPSVQIHHAGGGYEQTYEDMAVELASRGIVGIALIHRGYPGSQGSMEYGKGEIRDIGNLIQELRGKAFIDPKRMGIMGYSRGAHNALLALERYDDFRAGALWSTPVDMVDHVHVNPWIAEMFGGYPEEVPEEYRIRSSILFMDQIACPLLLIHGEMDDVVPVRHTLRLAQSLKDRQKPFELHLFPDEGHIWSRDGFNHNWELTLEFMERQLKQPAS